MNNTFKLSKKEVVVVFLVLFFLFMNLGAVSRKSHDIFICPVTKENDGCWGGSHQCDCNNAIGEIFWSSYGPNGWVMNPQDGTWGAPAGIWWGKLEGITTPSAVPLYLDSGWVDAWPDDTNIPPSEEFGYDGQGYMNHFLQNRHGNGVLMGVFADGSARAVGLKELWTLKWHREFDTNNPYTQPNAPWPFWMQGFQDY